MDQILLTKDSHSTMTVWHQFSIFSCILYIFLNHHRFPINNKTHTVSKYLHCKPESHVNTGMQPSRFPPAIEGTGHRYSEQQQLCGGEDMGAAPWPEAGLKGRPGSWPVAEVALFHTEKGRLGFPCRLPWRMNTVLLEGLPYLTQRMQPQRKRI